MTRRISAVETPLLLVAAVLEPTGMVYLNGELWRATSVDGPVPPGRLVRVVGVDGLLLRVTPVKGLERPWALAFLPDGDMLVTERPGRLRIVRRDLTLTPNARLGP